MGGVNVLVWERWQREEFEQRIVELAEQHGSTTPATLTAEQAYALREWRAGAPRRDVTIAEALESAGAVIGLTPAPWESESAFRERMAWEAHDWLDMLIICTWPGRVRIDVEHVGPRDWEQPWLRVPRWDGEGRRVELEGLPWRT